MQFPRLPDWLIYAAVVVALLMVAVGRQERADAPPPPPPAPEVEGAALGPASPFDPEVVVDVPDHPSGPAEGTAFSVDSSGVWVTARHVVDGCKQAAIVVGPDQGVEVQVRIDPRGEAALLTTEGGAPALPLGLSEPLRRGERGYHPGFPQGEPGEAASRLIGRENLVVRGRGARTEPVLVWAEAGRTDGLRGSLGGLSGAPALDAQGRVIGVTIAEAPRRGRIYTTTPETLEALLGATGRRYASATALQPITPDNYGRTADALRRDLRVAKVICLAV